jgi:NADH dehydrogenase FAD-containing subunit
MRQRVVILGGTGGTLAANRLRRELPGNVTITVAGRDDDHLYQPGVLFGLARDEFIDQVKDIVTVGEFYRLAAGGQIIFT